MEAKDNNFQHKFTGNDVTIKSKNRVYKGRFAIDLYELSHRKYNGGSTPVIKREVFERDQEAVAILPYDPKTGEVVLIEQFRPGAIKDPVSPWLIETVAGMVEQDEGRVTACIRELQEEAGIKVTEKDLQYINSVYPSPGADSERVSIYIAKVDASHLEKFGGLETEHEDIRVFKVKYQTALEMLAQRRISNAACVISLLYLEMMLKGKLPAAEGSQA